MSSKKQAPLVAICGRPNVGKSTLYNRLTGRASAIVHDQEGITRDRHEGTGKWNGKLVRVVDTGGIVENPIDPIVKKMQEQVRKAIAEAAVVVFVVDGRTSLTRVDYELRDELLKLGKPIVLAVNKLDNDTLEQHRHEFHGFGLGEPYALSATHGLGSDALINAILEYIPNAPAIEGKSVNVEGNPESDEPVRVDDGITRVAVVGRPNAGKSSFINALLGEERLIVHETPGTTRDAIDIEFRFKEREYILIDTAGMRKKAGIKTQVEHFSVARSLRAIRAADVCLVLIDAQQGMGEQDLKITQYASEQGTPMVLVWTKWDLLEEKEVRFKEIVEELDLKAPFLHYVPSITISSLDRTRIFKVLDLVDKMAESAKKRIATGPLNNFLARIKDEHKPPTFRGAVPKALYITQASARPTVFVMFVNQRKLFHFSYLRYIENRLRAEYGFEGVPIKLELREGKPEA